MNCIFGLLVSTLRDDKITLNKYYSVFLHFLGVAVWKSVLPLAVLAFTTAGYFLTYHLFFSELPLEDISWKQSGEMEEKFRFDGVAYFDGFRLEEDKRLELHYRVPRVISLAGDKQVEIFVRINNLAEGGGDQSPGSILLNQNGKITELDLQNRTLQRFSVDWQPVAPINVFQVTFKPNRSIAANDVVFATNLKNVDLLRYFSLFLLVAIALLGLRAWKLGRIYWGSMALVAGSIALMYIVHSGAFISNEYFPGKHGNVSGMVKHVATALLNGHFPETLYRSTGFALLPLVTGLVEGSFQYRGFHEIYPTSRYLMFVWVALSLSYLLLVVRKQIGIGVAILLGVLYATFHPFIVDLYSPDSDAYFIPLMTVLVGVYMSLCFASLAQYRYVLAIGVLIAVMISIKITPIFLVVLIPFSMWLHTVISNKKIYDRKALVTLIALLLFAVVGNAGGKLFQHPDRNVGKPGVEYQSHVGWHMIWAAYGLYDHHSAHWFTKSNKLRRERVEKATGLPGDMQYVHQSQIATELVYRPGVLRALDERPGFFYSTAFLRFYNDSLKLFRYTSAHGALIKPWLDDGFKGQEEISGEVVYGLSKEREMIRYGKMWKISPLVLVTKIQYGDVSRMTDIILIGLAIVGIFALRQANIVVFLIGCTIAKFGFTSMVHVMDRYMMFNNVALLIGLAVFLSLAIKIIVNALNSKGNPVDLPENH